MEEIEIKYELNYYIKVQCRVCLSSDRRLSLLGRFADIYKKLTSDIESSSIIDSGVAQLCSECLSLLRRVVQFQNRVRKANQLLQQGQGFIYESLSNLTSVVINDTHPNNFYMTEADTIVHKEESKLTLKPLALEENSDSNDYLNDDVDDKNENETDIKKKRHENKWAKRWALQNKKPKFKIVTNNDIKYDELYKRIQINDDELRICMERERDSEYFASKRYKCEKCILVFKEESEFLEHNKVFHDEILGKNYICDICNTIFKKKIHLIKHINTHYYTYKCVLCDFTSRDVKHRKWHFRKKHRKVFQCLKCELKFGVRRDFYKHFKECHEKFICDHCGISFKMRYCIKDHIRKQHSPFECKCCDKRFARYNGLWLHNKVHHSPPSAAAYCVECDKRYADIYRYKWHLANSAKHKPRKPVRVPCPGCDKYFSKKIYMKDHYNLVHLKFYKYRCVECDKNFTRNADLVKHNQRVHEGILPPKNKICYMCGRGFTTNKILTNHLRTHTGERPFACSTCGARFAQSTSLHAHIRAVHEKHART